MKSSHSLSRVILLNFIPLFWKSQTRGKMEEYKEHFYTLTLHSVIINICYCISLCILLCICIGERGLFFLESFESTLQTSWRVTPKRFSIISEE